MPDNPDRSHPAGISRRDALRGVLLGVFGLAANPASAAPSEPEAPAKSASAFVPEDRYPIFADDRVDSKDGKVDRV